MNIGAPTKLLALRRVILPAATMIEGEHLRSCFGGISRQLLHTWRMWYKFPNFIRDGKTSFYLTSDVASWIAGFGVEVERR